MLQNPCKTLGFKKNMVYKIPPGGGGKPYPASGLYHVNHLMPNIAKPYLVNIQCSSFVTHLMDLDIIQSSCGSHFFYHGTLQMNYRKMTIKWSFSYNSFVKLSL